MANPTKTLAAWIFEYGGPDKLIVSDYDLAPVGPRDVLVKNMGGSVGRWDVKYRSGLLAKYKIPGRDDFPLPQQLGREAAGEVLAVGAEVERFKAGDRVVAATHPQDPTSIEAARGLGNLSKVPMPGHQTLGSYAQYLVRDEDLWLHLPDSVDFEQAGVSLWAFSTSHRIVRDRLGVRSGEDVLVLGASGGMGQATVQIAKLAGARVITTTREESKKKTLLELGADDVIVTGENKDQSRKELRDLTGGQGVDHAVDFTGAPESLIFAKDGMRLGGNIVLTSEQGHDPVPFEASDFMRLELNLMGVRGSRMIDQLTLLKLMGEGKLKTRIAAKFPLTKIADAHTLFENSKDMVGRIAVLPWA